MELHKAVKKDGFIIVESSLSTNVGMNVLDQNGGNSLHTVRINPSRVLKIYSLRTSRHVFLIGMEKVSCK